jgi:two-component system sensor histidine kinase BaeS
MAFRLTGLAARLMSAQVIVIAVGAATLLLTAALVAPVLFSDHLSQSHVEDPVVLEHAKAAFSSAFLVSLAIGSAASLVAASVMSVLLVRRVAPPLQRLAEAAESVADGNYDVKIPDPGFGSELHTLARSFTRMSQRLEAVDASRTRLLNDLAHEIRTPLATLEVFVDGMEDDVVPINQKTYSVLHNQIARLQRLAHDVRDAANADEHALTVDTTELDLRHQIDLAVELARPQFQAKGVDLTCTFSATTGRVNADEQRLQQVLTNVLSNALRHTPTGGHVTVATSDTDGQAEIQIADDGEGIWPQNLDNVFERFYRGDPSRTAGEGPSGSGLGLTIARAITTEHHGTITAHSAGQGCGTTITIRIPWQM